MKASFFDGKEVKIMREILDLTDPADVFCTEAFVMDRDLLNQVVEALGGKLAETESHRQLLDEIAFRRGYGSDPGLSDAVLNAMQLALAQHEQRLAALGSCV